MARRQPYPARMSPPEIVAERPYDVVVWGATGFTGRLVVEYLAAKYPLGGRSLRWAIGGRDGKKLEQLRNDPALAGQCPAEFVADSGDIESLRSLAASTKVVLSAVGPYAKYGSELVAACVENGTDYCDLSGEVQWIRQMIDRHQRNAEATGARIVTSCGFDSIPSDFGAFCLQQHARRLYGEPCASMVLLVRAMKGGASGGTVASLLNVIDAARHDRSVARILHDPYALNPVESRFGPDRNDQRGPEFNSDAGVWTAPFVMAAINTRVVRRTNALLDFPYGRDFRYSEAMMTGRGLRGWLKAALSAGTLGMFLLAASQPWIRRFVLERFLPKPGQGPSRQQREAGFFTFLIHGRLNDGRSLKLRVTGDRDPGYGSTCKMLAESAVCLAIDEPTVGGGCWTPVAAMGTRLQDRLVRNAGLSFDLEPVA